MFTHIDSSNKPKMVDISLKKKTNRSACARAVVILPQSIVKYFINGDIQTKKGPVFNTAIVSGVMGAKMTWKIIPFCHNICLNSCEIKINFINNIKIVIDCIVKSYGKTGVEMEALCGANVAALTIYDMCKALSKKIRIEKVELLEKSGGKSDFYWSA